MEDCLSLEAIREIENSRWKSVAKENNLIPTCCSLICSQLNWLWKQKPIAKEEIATRYYSTENSLRIAQ